MDCYYCSCLNVSISVEQGSVRTVPGKDLIQVDNFEEIMESCDPYFLTDLLDVKLTISGIEVAHSVLSKERCYGDWLVFHCLNCCEDTHAIHAVKGVDRVLLPVNMACGKERKQRIKKSSSFSSVFKVKLIDLSEKHSDYMINLPQRKVLEATEKINYFLKKLIKSEEEAMQERIRLYKEKQQQLFLEFRTKANREKEHIAKTIRQFEVANDSLFDSINEQYFGTPYPESRDLSTDLPQFKVISRPIPNMNNSTGNVDIAQSLPSRVLSPSGKIISKNGRKMKSNTNQGSYRSRTFSDTDETLFDLEGFHEGKSCEPFYESDDDSSGDATSLESSGGYNIPNMRALGLNPGDRVYATSVPVEIPLFQNTKNSYEPESEDEEEEPSPSPNHIADSIKALAKSMQDSTSMFGELPRPRLNTIPYPMSTRR